MSTSLSKASAQTTRRPTEAAPAPAPAKTGTPAPAKTGTPAPPPDSFHSAAKPAAPARLAAPAPAARPQLAAAAGPRPDLDGLPTDTQSRVRALEERLGAPESSSRKNLGALVASTNFRGLETLDQAKLLVAFEKTDVNGRGHLLTLTNRNLNGKSALLDKDSKGGRLMDSLYGIAAGTLDPAFEKSGVTRASLLSSFMQEAGQPGQINQSNRGTCTVTSMQFMLNTTNPAEYGRLMYGLLSPIAASQLRGGDTLRRVGDSIAPDSATDRSSTERVFQAAMMEYANGGENYSNVTDKSTRKILFWTSTSTGLSNGEQEKGIEGLFGKGFSHKTGNVADLIHSREPSLTYIHMAWGKGKEGGHAIVGTRVQDGRVYFRNPWGPRGYNGMTEADPPRRMENSSIGEESMALADFNKWIKGAYV